MSMSKFNPAKGAAGTAEATGIRRRTVKKQTPATRTTKKAAITKLLRRKQGATLTALQDATGWQPHSLRAALTRLRKKGVEIRRATNAKSQTVYRAIGL